MKVFIFIFCLKFAQQFGSLYSLSQIVNTMVPLIKIFWLVKINWAILFSISPSDSGYIIPCHRYFKSTDAFEVIRLHSIFFHYAAISNINISMAFIPRSPNITLSRSTFSPPWKHYADNTLACSQGKCIVISL